MYILFRLFTKFNLSHIRIFLIIFLPFSSSTFFLKNLLAAKGEKKWRRSSYWRKIDVWTSHEYYSLGYKSRILFEICKHSEKDMDQIAVSIWKFKTILYGKRISYFKCIYKENIYQWLKRINPEQIWIQRKSLLFFKPRIKLVVFLL